MSDIAAKIARLEAQRPDLGDAAVDAAIAALRAESAAQSRQEMRAERIEHARQIVAENYYEAPPDPTVAPRAAAMSAYLRRTVAECNALPLGQIDRTDAAHTRPLLLSQLYIGLDTTEQVELSEAERAELEADQTRRPRAPGERPTRPLSALEALSHDDRRRTMLLGAPGSGKSTFVSHLALCLAGAALCERSRDEAQPESGWLACLPRWGLGDLLPVRVVLRDLAAFAPLAAAPRGSVRLLEEFLAATLADAGCPDALAELTAALRDGGALLLLDGLDEVVGSPVLQRVAETIRDADKGYRAPILVTCRPLDYREEPLRQIAGFPTFTLAELDDAQIQRFVGDWYRELAESGRRPAAQTEADTQALRDAVASRPELRALAGTPLLLTVMALVHAFRGTLPDARALLYYECIELLLLRWRQPRGESDLLEKLGLPQFRSSDLLALMAQLGYEAHLRAERDKGQSGPADLDEPLVMHILAEGFARYDEPRRFALAELVLAALTRGNGLLLKRGPSVYTFAHRTFQEFLAGYHLKGQRDYRKLCGERAPQAHWHEVLTLMVGYQVLQDRDLDKPLSLAEQLITRTPLEQALAGELLVLIGQERAAAYDQGLLKIPGGLWPRARQVLLRLLTQGCTPEAPAPLRHRAGLALGQLCYGPLESLCRTAAQVPMPDPRLPLAVIGLPAQRSAGWQKAQDYYWRPLAAGPFWYGDDNGSRAQPEDEGPLRRAASALGRALRGQEQTQEQSGLLQRMQIAQPCKIARFPVTNADYARFVAADGYAEQHWWTPEGWTFLQPGGHPYDDQEQIITCPRLWNSLRYNSPIQPVVGVSWYEAAAYCIWLTEQGHQDGWLPVQDEIRLPTSLEWERAARHTDQRRHPWGDDPPQPERANYDQTGINLPSPVGCFSAGAAVCGAEDLAGNVLEWMATPNDRPEQNTPEKDFTRRDRVLLSGSAFWQEIEQLCCGSRVRDDPDNRNDYWSFRVLWSPRST
ncbi:SUMF1/EgtB/PvdO family nonheme iron enzyme [Chloroflexales bacterium ZM16-3]|nr:SUMF1/EgtB/PvdO family nonheme iron enzyme [Chloroflexales bacterium ZM16-3]